MQPFDYYMPKDFDEAFRLLTLPNKAMYPLAGATDLIPHTRDGAWKPDGVVNIKGLPGLRDIKVEGLEPCCGCGAARGMVDKPVSPRSLRRYDRRKQVVTNGGRRREA